MYLWPLSPFALQRTRKGAPQFPSGEGVAALLGVLASWFEGSLRNYWWWEPFRSGPPAKYDNWPSRKFFRFSIPWSCTSLLSEEDFDF
jgi:hypothetical protein